MAPMIPPPPEPARPEEAMEEMIAGAEPEERAEHEVTCIPFMSWCRFCVAARADDEAHRRQAVEEGSKFGLPVVQMDFMFPAVAIDSYSLNLYSLTNDTHFFHSSRVVRPPKALEVARKVGRNIGSKGKKGGRCKGR